MQVNKKRFERVKSHDLYRKEKCDVMLPWRKTSGSQHSRTTEEKYELLFCSECNHVQECHTCQFFRYFFLPYLQNHGLLRSKNFVTKVTWRNDFSLLLEKKIKTYKLNRSIWFYASKMSSKNIIPRKWTSDSFGLRYLTKGCSHTGLVVWLGSLDWPSISFVKIQ